jgi:hypothetical protein
MMVLQIKDQLATIGNIVEEIELMNTTLNGFPSSWDPFFQGICAKRKLPKFNKLWADYTQEEYRLISNSKKNNDDENQKISSQVKKRKEKEKASSNNPKKLHHRKDASNIRCYICKEMGHYATQCPLKHEKGKKKYHAYIEYVEENKSKDEEYVL